MCLGIIIVNKFLYLNLSFLWTQTSGPSVQLSNRTDCSSMFQLNGDEASYEFELEISNGDTSDTDLVN